MFVLSCVIGLVLQGRTLVLVAGMPGAGKSTLLAGLPADQDLVVLDSDDYRSGWGRLLPGVPYGWYRPLVHLCHRAGVVRAAFSEVTTVLVHLPATAESTRSKVARLAAWSGRLAHLLWLDVDPAEALRGQLERGRVVPEASFRRHAERAATSTVSLRTGPPAGFDGVTVLDRRTARAGLHLQATP